MRCARCGNNNTDGNRFCGMCGAPLVVTPSVASPTQPSASNSTPAQPRPVAVPAPTSTTPPTIVQPVSPPLIAQTHAVADHDVLNTRPEQHSEGFPPPAEEIHRPERPDYPMITGPSFLGLSTPGPASRHRDPHSSSSNLDYLLEDEEEPKRGWGKWILIVAALALAVGFGYLHWRQGGFDWLTASNEKPAVTAPDAAQNPDTGAAPAPNVPDKTPSQAAGNEGTTPAGAPPPGASNAGASNSAPSQPPPQNASPDSAAPTSNSPAPPAETPAESSPPKDTAAKNSADSTSDANNSESEPAPTAKPSPTPKARERKPPAAKPVPPKPADSVAEAKRYIYGTGVTQDCDRGVRMLKAEQANPSALISLGTLYSAGTCTPRDLPTAYRWYAMALHKQPENQVLQDDLKSLWDKMTQPERQLAIRLSQ